MSIAFFKKIRVFTRIDGLVNSIDNSDVFGKIQGVIKYL